MKRHMKFHTREGLYKCGQCDQVFLSPSNLQNHEKLHTGERPYKCNYCTSDFKNPSTRNIHERIHQRRGEAVKLPELYETQNAPITLTSQGNAGENAPITAMPQSRADSQMDLRTINPGNLRPYDMIIQASVDPHEHLS